MEIRRTIRGHEVAMRDGASRPRIWNGMRSNVQQPTLVYLHVPKCGGTTLNTILHRNFTRRFYVNSNEIARSKRKLLDLTVEDRSRIDLLHGHISFGWHEHLPREAVYFTMIRDPVARVVSHYNYVRFHPIHSHYLRDTVEREKMTLSDYVQSGVCDEVNNGQVRLLSGVEDIVQEPYGPSKIPYGTNDRALLDQALHNVDNHFAVIGLQEKFDESLLLLKASVGIRKIRYKAQNVAGRQYTKMQPTTEDVAVIQKYNQLDAALYDIASRRFKRQYERLFLPRARTKLFRLGNRAYNRVRAETRTSQSLL